MTFVRPKPRQSPYWATFRVPRTFTKFDLRDYLLHAYGVMTHRVTSWVASLPIQRKEQAWYGRPGDTRSYKPMPLKYMSVELDRPFVWPKDPEDTSPWDTAMFRRLEKEQTDKQREHALNYKGQTPTRNENQYRRERDRRMLTDQARALLEGRATWDNGKRLDPKWEGVVVDGEVGKSY